MSVQPLSDDEIGRARSTRIEREVGRRRIHLKGRNDRSGPCPVCGGADRFAINISKQLWHCRGCDKGGDVIALVQHIDGVGFPEAVRKLIGEPPPRSNGANGHARPSKPLGRIVGVYDYVDESGMLLFQVTRHDPKDFRQRQPDGTRHINGIRRVLYRLPELIEAVSLGRIILIVEGEKDVDNLRKLGLIATCNAMGANKWSAKYNDTLHSADVVLIPDNDEAGWKHINDVGTQLKGIAARIRVLPMPNAKDASAWIEAGGTREQLDVLIEGAPLWMPPVAVDTKDVTKKDSANAAEQEIIDARRACLPLITTAAATRRPSD